MTNEVMEAPAVRDREERKLKKVKINLMRNPKFALWSGIMMVGKTQVSNDCPTAYTNGRDEVYGRSLIKEISEKELGFVVLHENLHKAFRHLLIWRKLFDIDAKLANIACDHVINLLITDTDPDEEVVAHPRKNGQRIGCYDRRFKGMNAKQVFDILRQEQQQGGQGPQGPQGPQGQGGNQPNPQGEGVGDFDEHGWDEAKDLSTEEKQELEKELDRALRQGQIAAKKAGQDGGAAERAFADLLKPEVDWREATREFVTSLCNAKDASSWRRVNRRFIGQDIYLPTLVGERVGRIVVGQDMSGSVGLAERTRFMSEFVAICENVKPERVDIMYWDSKVTRHEEYTEADIPNIINMTQPTGGGGTDPRAMMSYMNEKNIKPDCIIMLTDGCIDTWGNEWNAPILWAIVGEYGKGISAPVGKTIHVRD